MGLGDHEMRGGDEAGLADFQTFKRPAQSLLWRAPWARFIRAETEPDIGPAIGALCGREGLNVRGGESVQYSVYLFIKPHLY